MNKLRVKELSQEGKLFEVKVLEKVCFLCKHAFLIKFKTYKVQVDTELLPSVKSVSR